MSNENKNCKLRFKGIENFLRRVAFNLGNTPSQTEVKIISCIPIDVSDLQQKIHSLEKELEEAKSNAQKESAQVTCCPSMIIHTAVGCPASRCNTKEDDINQEAAPDKNFCHCSSVAQNSSNTADRQHDNSSHSCSCHSEESNDLLPHISDQNINQERWYGQNTGFRKIFLRKRNKNKRKYKYNAQVYYAQTNERTPFNKNNSESYISEHVDNASEHLALSRTFLVDMIQKQYKPEPMIKVFSNSSTFSAPVCKDVGRASTSKIYKCESEICSCCIGPYHNIDHHINETDVFSKSITNKKNPYYDSNLYDLVPVREKTARVQKRIKNDQQQSVVKACLEHMHLNAEVSPKVANFQNSHLIPVRSYQRLNTILVNKRSKQRTMMNQISTKATNIYPVHPITIAPTSKVGCVDCGPVYKKDLMKHNIPSSLDKDDIPCPTTPKDNTGLKAPVISEVNADIDKTATTLDQIKSILQSVLLEVKTNSTFEKIGEQPKKDAVVQNGASQGNIPRGSQFLQSFTYSPYNINQTSCSNKMYSSNCLFYPIIIPPQRHCCINCYKNNCKNKLCNKKRATSASTSTEHCQVGNNETKRLIKEIYKSIAMNIEKPQKDITENNYKISPNSTISVNPAFEKQLNPNTNVVSEIFRNTTHLDGTITRNTDNIVSNRLTREPNKDKNSRNGAMISAPNDKQTYMAQTFCAHNCDNGNVVNFETSCETESDDDIIIEIEEPNPPVEMNKKTSFFKKMLYIFKPKENNLREKNLSQHETDSESDFDDYQTSQINIRRNPYSTAVNFEKHLCKPRSPDNAKPMPEKQLQQRCRNEKLFHYNQHICPRMKTSNNRTPVYTQNHETSPLNPRNVATYTVRYNQPQNWIEHGTNKNFDQKTPCTRNRNDYSGTKEGNRGIFIHFPGKRRQGLGFKNKDNSIAQTLPRIIGPTVQNGAHKVSSKKVQTWLKNRNHVKCG